VRHLLGDHEQGVYLRSGPVLRFQGVCEAACDGLVAGVWRLVVFWDA